MTQPARYPNLPPVDGHPVAWAITRRAHLAWLLASLGAASGVRAQQGKTLRLIVPFTPGGSTDIVAPAGLPADGVARLNGIVNKALESADVAQQLAGEGAVLRPGSPQGFAELIAREIPRWREVVRAGNVKVD